MKLTRSTIFMIATNKLPTAFSKGKPLDYNKWVEFVDAHPEHFIWNEFTKSGIETLNNIDQIPENFKERVLASLNKVACYKEFDKRKGYYNINCSFSSSNNWIFIGFERKPRIKDFKIFVEMANYLNALLLKSGTKIIDEKVLEELSE